MKSAWIPVIALLAACNGPDTDSDSDMTGTDDTVTLSGTIVDAATQDPIEGVEVCFDEPADIACITTDATGAASTELPMNVNIKVRMTKAGYPTVLTHGNIEEADIIGARTALLSDTAADAALTILGETRDTSKGYVLFAATTDLTLQTKVEGATVTSTATTGTQFYASAMGIPDTSLTSTSAAGAGAIVNVDPGTYEITFAHTDKACVDGYGWPVSGSDGTMELFVEAGVMTFVSGYCN